MRERRAMRVRARVQITDVSTAARCSKRVLIRAALPAYRLDFFSAQRREVTAQRAPSPCGALRCLRYVLRFAATFITPLILR